jgi:mono/diheme cytochrome c family protein
MRLNQWKATAIALVVFPLLALSFAGSTAVQTTSAQDFDAATTFKAKCAMCHGADASKKFDATKADDVLVETVLKGRDVAPVKMPSYEAKGVTPDQAKALVAFMKTLKK